MSDEIMRAIDRALIKRNLSDAAASNLAVGHYGLIKSMRAGKGRYSWEALSKLAKVLDLQCYFGPKLQFAVDEMQSGADLEMLREYSRDGRVIRVSGYLGNTGPAIKWGSEIEEVWTPAPPYKGDLTALLVGSDDLAPLMREGDIVYVDADRNYAPADFIGRIVVAILEGSPCLKTLRVGDRVGTWNLESVNLREWTITSVVPERIMPVLWHRAGDRVFSMAS